MRKSQLELAEKILNGWLRGFNTNNWNDYIQLLSDNYIFNVPEEVGKKANMPQGTIELFDYLRERGIEEITSPPIRTAHNDNTFIFEFEEPLKTSDGSSAYLNFALSFDYDKGVIIECREYFGNRK